MLPRVFYSYQFHRATVAGLSFGASVIGARYLPTDQFSSVITAVFLVKFLQLFNFGATAGYFVYKYSEQDIDSANEPGNDRRYIGFFSLQLLLCGLLSLVVSFLWMPQYMLGSFAFMIFAPIYASEPYLRHRRNFSYSLTPDFVMAIGIFALIAFQKDGQIATFVFLATVALITLAIWLIAMWRQYPSNSCQMHFDAKQYLSILVLGMPVYLSSGLFLLGSSMDRLLLPLYGTEDQVSVYFLGYQLCVGSMIFVTAINFVNTVNLGETQKGPNKIDADVVLKKLRVATFTATSSFLALLVGAYILETFFLPATFDGLTIIVMTLGAGLSVFYTSNSITPLVAYLKRQMPLTIAMGFVALAMVTNNAWVYWGDYGIIRLAIGTAIALSAYGFFAMYHTFRSIRQRNEQTGTTLV